jgi:hypothetical protein
MVERKEIETPKELQCSQIHTQTLRFGYDQEAEAMALSR